MKGDPIVPVVHRLGRIVTRTLLSPALRDRPLARALYARLYLLGKRIAERGEQRFFREQVTPGMVVFDVGANLGFYTSLFADLVGPAGRVHAFEPDPLSFGILRRRTARRANVAANQAAAGDHSGTVTLYCNRSNRADNRVHASLGNETAETAEVLLTTLDDYCDAAGVDRIDAVKMDIQGAEIEALRGFRRTLARIQPRWLLIEFSPEHLRAAGSGPEDFWSILDELGFEPWAFGDDSKAFRIEDRAAFARRYERGYTDVWARRKL
ncbi:MAG: FkbM family methyltransferase [Thermoanaerobaculia bacterium]